ncbi:hypothetical protein M5D96_014046 [Drosophila gunungcola]|uniref:Uncharacterized protein n=1 Tax=Drosophila gunungcola TaxID=103775 RepID=A0A9P9YAW5_9MUSC|nr:hypothetical protein M5D96_014046 [Drosophila gunungcola]
MKTRSSNRDAGLRNSVKSPGKPLTPEKDKHMDACHDPVDTSDQCVQSQVEGELQNVGASEQNMHPEVIHIKSEPFCEDLWDVLDELGVILAEEEAESDLDEKPVITPPPPSITLADDSTLFTRRSKPDCDVSPISFNESLQESGEIASSEENNTEVYVSEGMEPVQRINSSAKDSQKELRSSPEENSRRHWGSTAHKEWSRSRSATNLVRRRLGNRVPFRKRSKSSSRPRRIPFRKRSRSRSISANVLLRESSRSAPKARSGSKCRKPKIVPRQSSRSPKIQHEERQRSVSQPAQNKPLESLKDKPIMTDRVASPVEAKQLQSRIQPPPASSSPILPRPISPMQVLYTHFTHLEYSAQHFPGYLAPGPYSQHPHELVPFDLRRRLATTRSLYCLDPHDLRHRIQDVFRPDIYSPLPAFNAYPEWPTGYSGQYHPSSYF